MKPYERVKIARDTQRPTANAYIQQLFTDLTYFSGDRRFGDDSAVLGGIGMLEDIPVTFIGIERGADLKERIRCNFGSPKPEGYRKALRLMEQGEKFHRPVICFVDTAGAFCGEEAEERGQGQAIAENLMKMMGLKTPILTIIIGEGGSGGALGLAVADKVYMLENAVYSVISPEGCASILWHNSGKAEEAAECLNLTAERIHEFQVAEEVIKEDFSQFSAMIKLIRQKLVTDIETIESQAIDTMLEKRYQRFRRFGIFETEDCETGNPVI